MGNLQYVLSLCFGGGITLLMIISGRLLLTRGNPEKKMGKNTLKKLEKQLPHFLNTVSSSLSSGNSLLQSLETAGEKNTPPLKIFIDRIITMVKAGMPLERALDTTAKDLEEGSFLLALHSMAASYRSGSNIVQSLSQLANTCRERENLQEKILARTAQSRMQGIVLTLVPFFFLIFLFISSPKNLMLVFSTSLGRKILVAAAIFQCMGMLVIRKMLKQEILG